MRKLYPIGNAVRQPFCVQNEFAVTIEEESDPIEEESVAVNQVSVVERDSLFSCIYAQLSHWRKWLVVM